MLTGYAVRFNLRYDRSGHAVLLGEWDLPGQNRQEVFSYSSQKESMARRRYREFLMEGISQREEGEPIESSLEEAVLPMGPPEDQEHDQRILGNREFLVEVRRINADLKVGALRMPIADLVERVAGACGSVISLCG